MGLIDKLFGKDDPTREWVADPSLELQVDLGRHSICGVRIGEPFDRLSGLGPAEDPRAARQDSFRYFSKGLEIDVGEGEMNGFVLVWRDDFVQGFQPFAGSCRYRGSPLPLGAGTTEAELRESFGDPYWRHQDEDEVILFYEFAIADREVEWQAELTAQGTLKALLVLSPPLLSDEEQRKGFGVTRAWPRS